MGLRGPVARPDAVGHHKGSNVVVLPGGNLAGKPPPAPKGLLPVTRREWKEFWKAPEAAFVRDQDLPAVRRLFVYRDKWHRAMAVVQEAMVVKGSMGQIRTNPLADYAMKLEQAIGRLETELGLTPMARARLGVQTSDAVEAMARLNARFAAGEGVSDLVDDLGDDDPRLPALVEPAEDG